LKDVCKKVFIDSRIAETYFSSMQYLWYYLAAMLICIGAAAQASDNPIILGVELPALEGEFSPIESDTVLYAPYPMQFDIRFYLSSAGMVDSFSYTSVNRDIYVRKLTGTLNSLRFFPAQVNNSPEPFILAGRLHLKPKYNRTQVTLQLPFDEPMCRFNSQLVRETFLLNDYELPGLESFPSYYCGRGSDTPDGADYPFVIYEISIDSTGRLLDYQELISEGTECAKLLSNVLLHARFKPASRRGGRFESRFYLIVRLFDSLKYPTPVWKPQPDSVYNDLMKYFRIESKLFPDSIMSSPYPVNIPGGVFKHSRDVSVLDSVEVDVRIDSLGEIESWEYRLLLPTLLKDVSEDILKKLRFSPARKFNGDRSVYDGRLVFNYSNSRDIRIRLQWLSDCAPAKVE